jgi:hypothetical protein
VNKKQQKNFTNLAGACFSATDPVKQKFLHCFLKSSRLLMAGA